jgi:hypothetical protein
VPLTQERKAVAKAESKRAKAEKKVRERLPDVPRVADEGAPPPPPTG